MPRIDAILGFPGVFLLDLPGHGNRIEDHKRRLIMATLLKMLQRLEDRTRIGWVEEVRQATSAVSWWRHEADNLVRLESVRIRLHYEG